MSYQDHLAHLVWIANMDKAYAWHRAKEMDAEKSGLWTGMAADLKSKMLALKSSAEQKPTGE